MTGGIAARYVPKSEPTTSLLRYDAACRALAEARGIDEVKDVRDKAEALRLYGRQAKNKTLEVDAAEIRFRAERRLGEMLSTTERATGAAGVGRRASAVPEKYRTQPPSLDDLGIDKKLSSRAQKIAAVPEAQFESMVATWRDRVSQESERVTTALVREGEKGERRAANQQPVEGGGRVEDLIALAASGYRAGTISADPAWTFKTWSERGQDRSAIQHYRTETLDEIMSRPVKDLAAANALLHLWCPSSMLEQGFQVIAAWGFVYKKVGFIWPKLIGDGSAFKMGNGHWTRDEAELCLLATRGDPERLDAGVRQVFEAPLGEHSEKPDEFYDRMRRLAAGPYLELYGRKEREHWTVWGDQVRWQAPEPRTADGEAYDPTTGELSPEENEHERDGSKHIGRAHGQQHDAPPVPGADGRREGADAGDQGQGPRTSDADPVDRVEPRIVAGGDEDRGSGDVGGEARHQVARPNYLPQPPVNPDYPAFPESRAKANEGQNPGATRSPRKRAGMELASRGVDDRPSTETEDRSGGDSRERPAPNTEIATAAETSQAAGKNPGGAASGDESAPTHSSDAGEIPAFLKRGSEEHEAAMKGRT